MFEILDKDLAGRIGKLKTRRGCIETPYLFPVVNPFDKTITANDLKALGFNALITNVLHVRRGYVQYGIKDVHELLGFDGPVMTDSGGYQLLVYGSINLTSREVIEIQEKMGSDIAVILDFPTGNTSYDEAKHRVDETLKRAEELMHSKVDRSILWVGPIQGAPYLDLVKYCAQKMSSMNFDIYAIGSPTTVMETYQYDLLVDLIYTAKRKLPLEKPIHLFGAGHPMMLSFAVALGCDLFDSASYILYAKEGRYLTPHGTYRVNELEYFPCSCPICSKYAPKDLMDMESEERVKRIALHNLYSLLEELKKIKEAIREGTLWDHVAVRARSHPRLYSAFLKFKSLTKFLERLDPSTKPIISGLFVYDFMDIYRPKVKRHLRKLMLNCKDYFHDKVLVLLPKKEDAGDFVEKLIKELYDLKLLNKVSLAYYCHPYHLIPVELDGIYPLSQYEAPQILDDMSRRSIARKITKMLIELKPRAIVLYNDNKVWGETLIKVCKNSLCKFEVLNSGEPYEDINDLNVLVSLIYRIINQQ